MNLVHRWICGSGHWKNAVENHILPWTLEGLNLGSDVLELGPGPGATTDLLRHRVPRLTCVEADAAMAETLRRRHTDSSVRILHEDATAMSLPGETFDAAVCFAMLHHVPSVALQDRLLTEGARVLRPGAIFAGSDSIYSLAFRLIHIGDTMVLVDPATFPARLRAAGFGKIQIDVRKLYGFRFRAEAVNTPSGLVLIKSFTRILPR